MGSNCWYLTLCLVGMSGLFFARFTLSEHIPSLVWMGRYTSASGTYCCSERDCVHASVALPRAWTFEGEGEPKIVVLVNGTRILLPAQSIHRSEDGQTYWCCKTDGNGQCPLEPTPATTRCVFYADGA